MCAAGTGHHDDDNYHQSLCNFFKETLSEYLVDGIVGNIIIAGSLRHPLFRSALLFLASLIPFSELLLQLPFS
jgi:hypothetical protein